MTMDEAQRGLRGRQSESAQLDSLLTRAAAGHSEVLVLRGEAGVGKTALLEYAVLHADGFTIVRATGVESEFELAYSVLQQVCAAFMDRIIHLPEPQQKAVS